MTKRRKLLVAAAAGATTLVVGCHTVAANPKAPPPDAAKDAPVDTHLPPVAPPDEASK